MDLKELREKLEAPMAFKFLPKPITGREEAIALPYIEAEQVIKRLNEVFGIGKWRDSYQILQVSENHVAMLCHLNFEIGEESSFVEGIGEAEGTGKENFKSAESDALKRACRKLGIGLFLYEIPIKVFPYDTQNRRFKVSQEEMLKELAPQQTSPTPQTPALCSECGTEIKGGKSRTGKEYTAQDIINYSQKNFGRILCPSCQKKIKDDQSGN